MRSAFFMLGVLLCASFSGLVSAEQEWPGEPIDNHVHLTWATLTLEVNEWADDNPDIVD